MNLPLPLALPAHEDLSRLARDDPPAFEALRQKLIDNLIDRASERTKPRLRGIQFQVDCLRRLSGSALGSTVKIYELMWKSFLDLNYNCQDFVQMGSHLLSGNYSSAGNTDSPGVSSAQVIQFRPLAANKPAQGKAK